MEKIRPVALKVHPKFFDGIFEPARRSYEKKFGIPISQVKFTEMIANKSNIKIRKSTLPKDFRRFKFHV